MLVSFFFVNSLQSRINLVGGQYLPGILERCWQDNGKI